MLSVLEQGKGSQQELDSHTAKLVEEYARFSELKNKEAEYIQIQLAIELRKMDYDAHRAKLENGQEAQTNPHKPTSKEETGGILGTLYSAAQDVNSFFGTDVITDKVNEVMTPVETQFDIPQVQSIMDLSEEEFQNTCIQ